MEIIFENVTINNILLYESFKIEPNKVIGLIGNQNKSVLAKVFAGIKRIDDGKIIIENDKIDLNGLSKDLNKKIGVLFNDLNLYKSSKTVKQQLLRGLEFYPKVNDSNKRMIDILKKVGLNENFLNKKISKLSLGEKKKVFLASIIIFNPEIIILDHFEQHLNYKDQVNLKKLLKELKKNYNKTIICITDNAEFLLDFVDSLLILDNMKIKIAHKDYLTNKESTKYIDMAPITNFCSLINNEIHPFMYYNNINELIKAVYRDVK